MANSLIIFTETGLKNMITGLGELPSKFVHALLLDIDAQLGMAEKDVKAHLALIEQHLAPAKAKLDAVEAEAKKVADAAEAAAKALEGTPSAPSE